MKPLTIALLVTVIVTDVLVLLGAIPDDSITGRVLVAFGIVGATWASIRLVRR